MNKLKAGFQFIDRKEILLKGLKRIILAGDVGCTVFGATSRKVLDKILKIQADLFIILGDLAYTGKKKEFQEVFGFCKNRVRVPIFTICGNHDLPGYYRQLGSSVYSVISGNFAFIFLDNSRGPLDSKNLSFLKSQLDKHKKKKSFIFLHVPPPNDLHPMCMNNKEWLALKRVLDRNKKSIGCILSAHIHAFRRYRLNGYHVIISGGGGAKLFYSKNDKLHSHHALRLTLNNKGAFGIKVISFPNA